ncbi:Sir2 family NAD-dependent protein deacetylase, partial [Pseudomonas aeruginosa]|uniref:Sir2 family NAD-dependent protein deacetylase n=2 Tax=Pseudomonas TaxID=286 RepID=UPI002AA2A840
MRHAAGLLAGARRLVVFTGAGVSAESGIPTFRDALDGLWARYDPAALATPAAFADDPALVWGWYEWRRQKVLRAQPNPAHRAIAALADRVADTRLVTQNVDDLHERAGSREVLHLHGSLHAPRCAGCAMAYRVPLAEAAEPEAGRRI